MHLIFVHGWSVTNTKTYGGLPEALVASAQKYALNLTIQQIHLGRYISFDDEITLDDIARAFDRALRDLPGNEQSIQPFSCLTHSTGGPVVRYWVNRYYGSSHLAELPLRHLIMLAPANHGSALAVLGKQRVGRMQAWFNGVEPGQQVLDWLSLGSKGQWELNQDFLAYDYAPSHFFPFVLTGQGIDTKFYDFLNSYLVESGSDGVVRVAGANTNYRFFTLKQGQQVLRQRPMTYQLIVDDKQPVQVAPSIPLGVYDCYSHSGKKKGIMASINPQNADEQPLLADIFSCLQVTDRQGYEDLALAFEQATTKEQTAEDRFSMLIFNIQDEQGNRFEQGAFDVFLLAGKTYSPDKLPKGFFKDRQINAKTSNLVYYLNAAKMQEIKDGLFGIRVVARPASGFSHYDAAEFRSDGVGFADILVPNQTTYVDIVLTRKVDKNVFRFAPGDEPRGRFKGTKPSGALVDE